MLILSRAPSNVKVVERAVHRGSGRGLTTGAGSGLDTRGFLEGPALALPFLYGGAGTSMCGFPLEDEPLTETLTLPFGALTAFDDFLLTTGSCNKTLAVKVAHNVANLNSHLPGERPFLLLLSRPCER